MYRVRHFAIDEYFVTQKTIPSNEITQQKCEKTELCQIIFPVSSVTLTRVFL